jgi:hypothetical protein
VAAQAIEALRIRELRVTAIQDRFVVESSVTQRD